MAGPAGGPLGNLPSQLSAVLPGPKPAGGQGGASRHLNPMQFGNLAGGGEAAGGAAAGGEAAAGGSLAELAPLALAA